MSTITKSVDVDRDVHTVYNQWTQFEEFPQFMDGVERVIQLDDTTLHWETEIGLADREFDARITTQEPDRVIAWQAIGETNHGGHVEFEPLAADRTRVRVTMTYDPHGFVEKAGDKLGMIERRVEGDVERFKAFIESRGAETGAWRGEVHGGTKDPGTSGPTGTVR